MLSLLVPPSALGTSSFQYLAFAVGLDGGLFLRSPFPRGITHMVLAP